MVLFDSSGKLAPPDFALQDFIQPPVANLLESAAFPLHFFWGFSLYLMRWN
jgi:hypothetical protein